MKATISNICCILLKGIVITGIFISSYGENIQNNYNLLTNYDNVKIIINNINEKSLLADLYANKKLVINLDNNSDDLKIIIKNITGVIIKPEVTNILIYFDNNQNLHLKTYLNTLSGTKINQIINNDIKNIDKNVNLFKLNSDNNFYPIKKIYLTIGQPIGKNGFINLEYEISQVRSYDTGNSKNKKYVFITLNSGRIVTTDNIYSTIYQDVGREGPGHIITGIGPIIYNSEFETYFKSSDNNIILEKSIPENMNNSFSQNFSSSFGIGMSAVSPFGIPIPTPSWNWSTSFTVNSNMYNIIQRSNGANPLNVVLAWKLDRNNYYVKWSNYNDTWWRCWTQETCDKGYYSIDKVQTNAMSYNLRPDFNIAYSSNIDNISKNTLFLNTTVQYGDLLTFIDKSNAFYWSVYPAQNDKTNEIPIADLCKPYYNCVNTMKQFKISQEIEINWDAPVFYQYFPMIFNFVSLNKCLTQSENNNKLVTLQSCYSKDQIQYSNQKWYFDANNKLIRSFNEPNLCLSYNEQDAIFNLESCNDRTSIKSWMSQDDSKQFHYLHYGDEFIGTNNNNLIKTKNSPEKIIITMDSY